MLAPVTVASKLSQVDEVVRQLRLLKAPSSERTRRWSVGVRSATPGLAPRSVKESGPRSVADWAVATVNVAFADPPEGTLTLTGAALAPNGRPDALRVGQAASAVR